MNLASPDGETVHAGLAAIPFRVHIVDAFRAAGHVPAIVGQCLALHSPALRLQQGIVHEAAAQRAQAAGMRVVMARCLWKEQQRLLTP